MILLLGSPLVLWASLGAGGTAQAPPSSALSASGPVSTVDATIQTVDPSPAPTSIKPSDYCVGRFLSPIDALASGPPPEQERKAPDWLHDVERSATALRVALRSDGEQPSDAEIETLIVTVPDPIESGLVQQYETSLQALRTGVEHALDLGGERSQYFRDRSFLPWDDLDVPPANQPTSARCRGSLPGILLFRNSEPMSPRVFAALLVGETPTVGLHGAVMLNALRIARTLQGHSTLRALGPRFSGGAYSLRLALRHYAEEVYRAQPLERLRFQVVTGTANGASIPSLMRSDASFTPNSQLSFSATIAPQADVECAYFWFTHKRLGSAAEQAAPPANKGQTRTLPEVAILSELGTEFGTGPRGALEPGCKLQAGLSLSFPTHISNLRDAYESLDTQAPSANPGSPIARATSLDAPLTDARVAQDVEANPSPKTRAALDVMLSSLLREISVRRIRHVGIHATDVGDALFLARKIRDVAPDVRLAFFDSDILLMHTEFRSLLLGSLVVSSYPFLGINALEGQASSRTHVRGFPNALAEATFNAVLAQRGAVEKDLIEYSFRDEVLPTWISTISRTGLEPANVHPAKDASEVIYRPTTRQSRARSALQGPLWRVLRKSTMSIDPSLPLPRLWYFVVATLVLCFFLDQTQQLKRVERLSKDAIPVRRDNGDDRYADRAIARTKWWLYAAIRTFLFFLALAYLGSIFTLSLIARDVAGRPIASWRGEDCLHSVSLAVVLSVAVVALYRWLLALRQFHYDYVRFGRYVGERLLPRSWADVKAGIASGRISSHEQQRPAEAKDDITKMSSRPPLARWTLSLGLAPPVTRDEAARISFAQLRNIAVFAFLLTVWFSICLVGAALSAADFSDKAVPLLTLNVLRSMSLLNGISPATPALLCIGCVYAWVVGRMARIALAHSISSISPADRESDLVSTPLRLVLYPGYRPTAANDDGYTRCERDLLNAIWRPITGRNYVASLFAVMLLPILLIALKPLSTLESSWGTALLGSGLALSMMLIGVTLIQQIQYWICLERLLKRTLTHRLGPVLGRLPSYVRDTLDQQLSRSSNELLRWSSCARQLVELAATSGMLRHESLTRLRDEWSEEAAALSQLRAAALAATNAPDLPSEGKALFHEEIELCEQTVHVASRTTQLLEAAWGVARRSPVVVVEMKPANESYRDAEVEFAEAAGSDYRSVKPSETTELVTAGRTSALVSAYLDPAQARSEGGAEQYTDGEDALAAIAHHFSAPELTWLRRAQTAVAIVVTLLIHRHVRQFRYFASTLTAACLLLLLTITSYPFEPFRLLLTWIWVVVGTVAAASSWIYLKLHKNRLICLISGTSPNEMHVNTASVVRLFAWAGLPLLSVAAAQYPELASLLFKLIAPLVRAIH